jgi:hypothetical protein
MELYRRAVLEKFREMIINDLSKEKREILTTRKFTWAEFNVLVALWKNPIFRDVVFSLDVISKVGKHNLPNNPLYYIIGVMLGIFERYYKYFYYPKELEIPWSLWMYIDNLYPAYYKKIKEAHDANLDDFQDFKIRHQAAFNLICKKFKFVEFKESYKDIPTMEIIKITNLKKPRR